MGQEPDLTDPAVFEDLIRRHERSLRQFAYRILGSREKMEDAVQEACLKAYRALGTFEPRGEAPARAWLFQILYRTCMDELRRRRHEVTPLEDAGEEPAGANAADEVAGRSGLALTLAQLPVDLRGPVLLVDLLGFDYRTAAHLLGLSTGTVGSRLNRARASLRLALTESVGIRPEVGDE